MNADWPKTVRVGGDSYELHPGMGIGEFMDVANALENEVEKFTELADSMGMPVTDDRQGVFDGE